MLAANPVRVMKPSAAAQIVGLVPVAEAICGVGLTVTVMLLAGDVHPFTLVVALYVPDIAVVALARVGLGPFAV